MKNASQNEFATLRAWLLGPNCKMKNAGRVVACIDAACIDDLDDHVIDQAVRALDKMVNDNRRALTGNVAWHRIVGQAEQLLEVVCQ